MAAKGLVLALVITGVVAFDLNCHMSRDRVGVLLDQQYSWVFEKCDRLIANIGNPDILGHLEADSTLMGKLQSARANNSNIKLFLAVEIYPLAVPLLAYKAYKDNIVQSVAGILMDRNLDGAVFDFDPKFEGTLAVDGVSKTRIYHLMNALKKSVGSQGKSIGLVAPLNGPLQLKSPADCRSLDQVFDFIELATQEILVNFEENLLSHRSALGPVAGNTERLQPENQH
ncbi:hypothetical protein HDE_03958 [Halotydeus destructor]|nr:hypothetical protein HDE_03958 [Halotydeus destructor]